MAFNRQDNVTITGFTEINISLVVTDIEDSLEQQGRIKIMLTLSNGRTKYVDYDLLERLEDDAAGLIHRTNLINMRDYIISRITSEVLPL